MIFVRKKKVRTQVDFLEKEIDSMRDILSRKYQVSKYEYALEHNCKYVKDMRMKEVGQWAFCIECVFFA